MKPLTLPQFRDALRKGQGRAYLHVRRYGDAGVGKALLEACRRDLRYDAQVECDREEWIYSLLETSGQPERYRNAVLRQLSKIRTADDGYGFALAGQFAKRGDPEARGVIRTTFTQVAKRESAEMWAGVEAMMDAEGMEGFLQAAATLDAQAPRFEEWGSALSYAEQAAERFGWEKVESALRERARQEPAVQRFVEALQRAKEKSAEPFRRPNPTVKQVLDAIETGRAFGFWGY